MDNGYMMVEVVAESKFEIWNLVLGIIGLMIGGVTVPVMTALYANKRAIKEALERRQREEDTRHRENLSRFNKLIDDRKYHRPHSHGERPTPESPGSGTLCAENITFSPLKINGDGD